jgi:hypothetical protein
MNELEKFGNIPIDNAVLLNLLGDYNFPRNKISAMEQRGDIIRLKKGLFVVSEKISRKAISRELVANHLYSPSYVSLETALAYYGLIPERVYSVRSICTKMHKNYDTPLGHFEFVKAPSIYFSIGIRQKIVNDEYAFLIASPEKALCDKIICTPNIRIQSVKAVREYLEADLRFEMLALRNFDIEIIKKCAEFGKKKTELNMLGKLLLELNINYPNRHKN